MCTVYSAHTWLSQGTILVTSHKTMSTVGNSGEKYDCQNNKSFFAVIYILKDKSKERKHTVIFINIDTTSAYAYILQ